MLGLDDDATADDVRAARRRLAKELHPDVAGGDAEAMRELNEAVSVVLAQIGGATRTSGSVAADETAAVVPEPVAGTHFGRVPSTRQDAGRSRRRVVRDRGACRWRRSRRCSS